MCCFGSKKKQASDEEDEIPVQLITTRPKAATAKLPARRCYSDIVPNGPGVGSCIGCLQEIDGLIEELKRSRKNPASTTRSKVVFHENFIELEKCAEQCGSCRSFRKALLLRQPSKKHEGSLYDLENQKPIQATILPDLLPSDDPSKPVWALQITVGDSDEYASKAYLAITKDRNRFDNLHLKRIAEDALPQISNWLSQCGKEHDCKNLAASSYGPTRLIKILEEPWIRLIQWPKKSERPPYVILSYRWSENENSTTTKDNLSGRLERFSRSDLPPTLEDAIDIARSVGIEYIWIDQVCIIQDSDEDKNEELPKMHEYYGNAEFTLCAASVAGADEPLLRDRDAWMYNPLPFTLNGHFIHNLDVPLDEARSVSALSGRGWVLQEEYLSPRKLYWFGHGLHWACASAEHFEGVGETTRRPPRPPAHSDAVTRRNPVSSSSAFQPDSFLRALYEYEDPEEPHRMWLRIVELYARRDLSDAMDRFRAISGVAARYIGRPAADQYLAGLWARTFAEDLHWTVVGGAAANDSSSSNGVSEKNRKIRAMAPSWSWASLPLRTEIRYAGGFKPAEAFRLVDARAFGPAGDSGGGSLIERIERGSVKQPVTVRGRLHPFWSAASVLWPWSDVTRARTTGVTTAAGGEKKEEGEGEEEEEEEVSFARSIDRDAHAVDPARGRVVVHRAYTRNLEGRLDYAEDAARAAAGGGLRTLWCLEVGAGGEGLLLEELEVPGNPRAGTRRFRRVGAARELRWLFDESEVVELCLV